MCAVTAIIPVLNAADTLPATLAVLVVVDGGSGDDSAAIARAAGARVITAARGRGPQLAAGAAAANRDWRLFLHADCRPLPGWEAAASRFIGGGSGRAGYFALALDDPAPPARRVELLAAWRCRVLAL